MKIFGIAMLAALIISSCNDKDDVLQPLPVPPHPAMEYIDLHDRETGFNQPQHIDLDGDGARDFSIATLFIGDPILERDIIQFFAGSAVNRFLMVNPAENAPVLNHSDIISINARPGYQWSELAVPVLSEKIIAHLGQTFWQGPWKTATHKYLPFSMKKNGLHYYGWFELSMNINTEKVILHRAAVCKEPGKEIKAGI